MKRFSIGLILFLILSLGYTAISACHWPVSQFCDETDAYAAAMVIADGGSLYGEYITQHMPGQSYLCALFRILGADSVLDYRIAFFACLAMLWAGMFLRYRKWYGQAVMLCYPIFYLGVMALFGLHSSVPLAEHIAAQGVAILALEMIHFVTEGRRLSATSLIWIGAAVGLSFCFLFMSAYQIAVVALVVFASLLSTIPARIRAHRKGVAKLQRPGLTPSRFLWLIVSCAAPVFLMLGLFAAFGHLSQFINQAYTFNRNVYSRYTGLGQDPWAVLPGAVSLFVAWFSSAIAPALTGDLMSMIYVCCVLTNVWSLFVLGRKSALLSIGCALLLLVSGARGFDSFHSISYYGLTMLFLLIALFWELQNERRATPTLAAAAILVVMLPFLTLFPQYSCWRAQETPSDVAKIVAKITEEDDKLVVLNLDWGACVGSNRTPLCMGVMSLPWYNEAYGYAERTLLLRENPPVVLCDLNLNVWGYSFKEYSSRNLIAINSHYKPLDDAYPFILVRKDYLETARERLSQP